MKNLDLEDWLELGLTELFKGDDTEHISKAYAKSLFKPLLQLCVKQQDEIERLNAQMFVPIGKNNGTGEINE